MRIRPWLDRWTLIHFMFWAVIGGNYHWHKVPAWAALVFTAIFAVLWEVVELVLEKLEWVSGKEKWQNRWVSDILIAFVGIGFGYAWVKYGLQWLPWV